jgi:cytochrome c biogenesis protein
MRTALVLLMLLALAAIPGSLIPQARVDAQATRNWQAAHPGLTPLYQKLGLFSVYSSAWFAAIYLLLMVSLVGCIVPRLRVYARAAVAPPPPAPRHLGRLPLHRSGPPAVPPDEALTEAAHRLRRLGYRVRIDPDSRTVSAQRGYLREAGNLLFHLAVVFVLLAYAYGSLYGFKGAVIVVAGQNFSNTRESYDDFLPGGRFDPTRLAPFNFSLKKFTVDYLPSGPEAGLPTTFKATVDVQSTQTSPPQQRTIQVNHPLTVDGTGIYLVGNGYAPVVTIKDPRGRSVYSGPTVALPRDQSYASYIVIKAPDAKPQGLGFEGMFLPTYADSTTAGPYSAFPNLYRPALSLTAYHGDLGLDRGAPQSVYTLDKQRLQPYRTAAGSPRRLVIPLGSTRRLPDGSTIEFTGVRRWARFQIGRTPGETLALGGIVLGLIGMLGSLFVRPRRVWVRAKTTTSDTEIEIGALERHTTSDRAKNDIETLSRHLLQEANR